MKCQQFEDDNQEKLTDSESLELPERRWGLILTDFIVNLPNSRDWFDAITT